MIVIAFVIVKIALQGSTRLFLIVASPFRIIFIETITVVPWWTVRFPRTQAYPTEFILASLVLADQMITTAVFFYKRIFTMKNLSAWSYQWLHGTWDILSYWQKSSCLFHCHHDTSSAIFSTICIWSVHAMTDRIGNKTTSCTMYMWPRRIVVEKKSSHCCSFLPSPRRNTKLWWHLYNWFLDTNACFDYIPRRNWWLNADTFDERLTRWSDSRPFYHRLECHISLDKVSSDRCLRP